MSSEHTEHVLQVEKGPKTSKLTSVYAAHDGRSSNTADLGIVELSNSLNGINYVTNSNIRPGRVRRVRRIGSLQEPHGIITATDSTADASANATADSANNAPPRRNRNIEVSNPGTDEADEKLYH